MELKSYVIKNERVEHYMNKRNISASELSRMAGYAEDYVSKALAGKRVSKAGLDAIADALGLSADSLVKQEITYQLGKRKTISIKGVESVEISKPKSGSIELDNEINEQLEVFALILKVDKNKMANVAIADYLERMTTSLSSICFDKLV